MNDRIACCVEGCSRSIGVEPAIRSFGSAPSEWICPTHWRLVSRQMKRVWSRVRRRERRFGASLPGSARLWDRLKREATP